nr:hypothetical protein [uncultured Bradyrhizobium sp.]
MRISERPIEPDLVAIDAGNGQRLVLIARVAGPGHDQFIPDGPVRRRLIELEFSRSGQELALRYLPGGLFGAVNPDGAHRNQPARHVERIMLSVSERSRGEGQLCDDGLRHRMIFGPYLERPFRRDDNRPGIDGGCMIGAPDQGSIDANPVDLGRNVLIDLDGHSEWNADPCAGGGRLAFSPGGGGAPVTRLHGDIGLRAQGHKFECRGMLAMARQIGRVTRSMFGRVRVAGALRSREMMLMSSGFDNTDSPDGCGHCRYDSERNRETCSHYLPQQLTVRRQPVSTAVSPCLICIVPGAANCIVARQWRSEKLDGEYPARCNGTVRAAH